MAIKWGGWRPPRGPKEPTDIVEESINTLQQMLKGFQMWRKAWRDVQGWATEGRPEAQAPTPQSIMQAVSPWMDWAKSAASRVTRAVQTPFWRWRP